MKLCFVKVLDYAPIMRFFTEIETIFKNNNYPQNLVNQYIEKFLNKLFVKKTLISYFLKGGSTFVLPYLGKVLLDLRFKI